ncbi:MAG TPA: DNA gyrase inhibitor YacG [Dongiaceae bacterium]|jgi:hypothetical protein|nr:DNA gyrase inhibitor YacG [Dongiaceae bacterium]
MSSKASGGGCPICGKPADPKFKPFCSQRCRQVDLNRWLSGNYRIPGTERSGQEEDGKNQSESED